jgi:hypothetical protein
MTELARALVQIIVHEYSAEEFLRRLSDPIFFQSLGCALSFDWHSSGLTTSVCGAFKEGIKGLETELGLFIAGGKGRTSLKTPDEIQRWGEKVSLGINPNDLIYASRLSAKVDNTALQNGFQIYHHAFIFTKEGKWTVVQQGMNTENRWARRYHWLGDKVKDFVDEPHSGIISEHKRKNPLNMVAHQSNQARKISAGLAKEKPKKTLAVVKRLKEIKLPARHEIFFKDLRTENLNRILLKTYEQQPQNFEQLLGIRGVGPKTVRALALISELVYGAKPSYTDPVRYSFAHGGKDGHPYPISKAQYDQSIEILRKALMEAKIGRAEKLEAIKRLSLF